MKISSILEARYSLDLYKWSLGDYNLGEADDGQGTLQEMGAAVVEFTQTYTDIPIDSPEDIVLGENSEDYEDDWIVVGEGSYDVEDDDEEELDGNMLPGGAYIIGTYIKNH